jgi:hypothetical protein
MRQSEGVVIGLGDVRVHEIGDLSIEIVPRETKLVSQAPAIGQHSAGKGPKRRAFGRNCPTKLFLLLTKCVSANACSLEDASNKHKSQTFSQLPHSAPQLPPLCLEVSLRLRFVLSSNLVDAEAERRDKLDNK